MIFYMLGLLSYYRIAGKPVPMGICIAFFLVMSIPPVTTLYLLMNKHWLFPVAGFIAGCIYWTFLEYFIHRFWVHRKRKHPDRHQVSNQKIVVPFAIRLLMILTAIVLIYYSMWQNRIWVLPAGVISGSSFLIAMNQWFHSRIKANIFPKLQSFHAIHMNGAPDRCFGITVIWWDLLFNTGPSTGKPIRLKLKKVFQFIRLTKSPSS